jgi:L-ascorbate metabolism protein UlaG (beta-lactamase superfamily)
MKGPLALALIVVLALPLLTAACNGGDEEPSLSPGATITPTPGGTARPVPTAGDSTATLTWFGHSMFLLTSPGGTTILIDPNSGIGYEEPDLPKVTVVTITHDHFDHNKAEVAGTGARVLEGIESGEWVEIDEQVGDVGIKTVPTYHDDKQGADRGKNSMFLFKTADLRILHAGDLGHTLTDEQVASVGDIDVLLIPVGGHMTIGPEEATQVMEQLDPSFVIPMHYWTDVVSFSGSENLEPLDPFLRQKAIRRADGNTLALSRDRLFEEPNVIVMDYR